MSTKFDLTEMVTFDPQDFLRRVWPEFLQNFENVQRTITGGISSGNLSAALLLTFGSSGVPIIFIPTIVGNKQGPNNDGWVYFSASSGRRVPVDITISKADIFFQNKLPEGGTLVIRNIATAQEGSVLITASDSVYTGANVSPAVSFRAGQGMAVRATGSRLGSGVTINCYGV